MFGTLAPRSWPDCETKYLLFGLIEWDSKLKSLRRWNIRRGCPNMMMRARVEMHEKRQRPSSLHQMLPQYPALEIKPKRVQSWPVILLLCLFGISWRSLFMEGQSTTGLIVSVQRPSLSKGRFVTRSNSSSNAS